MKIYHDKRTKVVNETFEKFGVIVGQDSFKSDEVADNSITTIIAKLRNLIGISELTELRATAIKQAAKRVKSINENEFYQ